MNKEKLLGYTRINNRTSDMNFFFMWIFKRSEHFVVFFCVSSYKYASTCLNIFSYFLWLFAIFLMLTHLHFNEQMDSQTRASV